MIPERSDSIPKVIEVEQGVNPSLSQSDPSSRKYREYPSVSYPDDSTLVTVSILFSLFLFTLSGSVSKIFISKAANDKNMTSPNEETFH